MTWLRALWASLIPLAVCRQEPPTIAEMRKASHVSAGPRFRYTQPADPKKLRGSRAVGKVRDIHEWSAKHDRPRRIA